MILKRVSIVVVFFALVNFQSTHKYYVSSTKIIYNESQHSFQVFIDVFTDDLQAILNKRYGKGFQLDPDSDTKDIENVLERYLKTKCKMSINDEKMVLDYVGKKYDRESTLIYMQFILDEKIQTITFENTILTDLFEEQKNIVQFKGKGLTKSYLLDIDKKHFEIKF